MDDLDNQQPSFENDLEEGSETKGYRSDSIAERPMDPNELSFCACGCGLRVTRKSNKWLKGHNRRKYSHELPQCACGCGQPIRKHSTGKRFKYLWGHHMRLHDMSGENNPAYGIPAWNKGLTKETDTRVAKYAEGVRKSWIGRSRRKVGVTYSKVGRRKDLGNVYFKSRWEANIARLFNLLEVKWQYEPKVFDLGDFAYAPDFYLPEQKRWVEVKGWMSEKSKKKIVLFQELSDIPLDIIDGPEYTKIRDKFSRYIPEWEFDSWVQ